MAVKQNGVLGTFTPTVSKYTNNTVNSNYPNNALSTNGWCMYTCPTATLMSGKVTVSNNTGSAAAIDIGVVEQTDVLQLDALSAQPGGNTGGYGKFSFPSGTNASYATSVVIVYANLQNGPFVAGENLTWTNTNRGSGAAANMSAIIEWVDAPNNKLWIRTQTHPLALELPAGDTTFTGSVSGATCSVGTSYAGTSGTAGHSGWVRFYDSLTGKIFFQSDEFRNNLDYKYLYLNDAFENREQNNNNLNRSNGRIWRPVASTVTRYLNTGSTDTPATEFIDASGTEVLISSVSQATAEQYLVKGKSVSDNDTFELNGVLLGAYQSIFVSSSAAVTFTLSGFEETAESPS